MYLFFSADASDELLIDLGDPVGDLAVASVLMVVGGQLILLRPRKVGFYPSF